MDRGRGGFGRGNGFSRGGRGRGMMRGGGFSNGGPPRGGMMRGGRNPRGPPRMGLGYNGGQGRGMNPRGRGRGGFQGNQSGDYFQNQQTNENVTVAPTENITTEKPATATPVTTQQNSGNNVQVVTTPQPINTQPPQSVPPQTSSIQSSSIPPSRGAPRGRGFSRGSFSGRGRGNFNQGMPPRQQFDTRQPSNLTPALPPKMSRYEGSMPPKRGRYDNGPYMGNRMSQNQPPPPMQSSQHHQGSYNNIPQHGAGYQDQSQYMEQYQHGGYNNAMSSQGGYASNGSYGQSYGPPSSQMGYQTEYDHSGAGYQDYGASSYDARYAGYSQYGTSADGYGQVSQDSSYSYEARSGYGSGYDQSYSQSYNSQGYY